MPAISRATPTTLRQSGRFGVRPSSRRTSLRPSAANTGMPSSSPAGRIMIPSALVARPSSLNEQSMPLESWPRIFDFLILKPPGSSMPTWAKATRSPVLWLVAPQTTCTVTVPVSTVQRVRRSASGCGLTSARRATMTLSSPAPSLSMASTSRPTMVRPVSQFLGFEIDRYVFLQPVQGDFHRKSLWNSGVRIQYPEHNQTWAAASREFCVLNSAVRIASGNADRSRRTAADR